MAVAVAAVVVVVMGVGLAVALVRARAVSGDEDKSGDRWWGPYNNQLKGPVEERTAVATVTAKDTVTATVKATEIGKNNAANDDGASRTATRTTSPGGTSMLETSPLPWHSVSVAMTVRKNWNNKKYTAQPLPIQLIVQLFCCRRCRLL